MLEWLKNKFLYLYAWFRRFFDGFWAKQPTTNAPTGNENAGSAPPSPKSLNNNPSNNQNFELQEDAPNTETIDFTSYNEGGLRFYTTSYAQIYDMNQKRKWQWAMNFNFLAKSSRTKIQAQNTHAELLAQFSQKEELLRGTDLSFDLNPIGPLVEDASVYLNQKAFDEYYAHLAPFRQYHLFAQILMSLLKKNFVSTTDLLGNLLHARNQLIEGHFFEDEFTLLYIPGKSQQWIASLLYRVMPKVPVTITKLDANLTCKDNPLLCDDICYTGTQVCEYLETLAFKYPTKKVTLLFGRMSLYALSKIQEKIKCINEEFPNFKVNIVAGHLFHTLSVQLDSLPFPPTRKERHIIKQLLEANHTEQFRPGDFRRKPLLTTGWKKPDYVSSYYKFFGFGTTAPDVLSVSADWLSQPPNHPITLFSQSNPAPEIKISGAFINGPQPPYSF